MSEEEWKAVLGYEGLYEVSTSGNIRSLDRHVRGRDGSVRKVAGQELTPRVRPDGTVAINLWKDNAYKQVAVRKLVLEAFDRPQPHGFEAHNVDGDPSNNSVRNLRWMPDRRARAARRIRA